MAAASVVASPAGMDGTRVCWGCCCSAAAAAHGTCGMDEPRACRVVFGPAGDKRGAEDANDANVDSSGAPAPPGVICCCRGAKAIGVLCIRTCLAGCRFFRDAVSVEGVSGPTGGVAATAAVPGAVPAALAAPNAIAPASMEGELLCKCTAATCDQRAGGRDATLSWEDGLCLGGGVGVWRWFDSKSFGAGRFVSSSRRCGCGGSRGLLLADVLVTVVVAKDGDDFCVGTEVARVWDVCLFNAGEVGNLMPAAGGGSVETAAVAAACF